MAKKTEATTKNGKAEGPLETLKAVYDFMTQNGLDSVEIAEGEAQIKLVRRKTAPTQVAVAVPVPVGGAVHAAPSAAPVASAPSAINSSGAAHAAPAIIMRPRSW